MGHARTLQEEFGVPLPDQSFDLVFSEYGAAIWCDPNAWIPEAKRLLRPGGRLIFLVRFYVRRGWARRWPCEEVWVARSR